MDNKKVSRRGIRIDGFCKVVVSAWLDHKTCSTSRKMSVLYNDNVKLLIYFYIWDIINYQYLYYYDVDVSID